MLAEGTGAALECETDKFSTYMIAYKEGSGATSAGVAAKPGATAAASPKTGDSIPVVALGALAIGAVALLLLASRKRREQ